MKRTALLGASLVALGLVCARAAHAQPVFYGAAARINGVEISSEILEHSFEEYLRERGENIGAIRNPERVKELKHETLDVLIDQELAWQAAQTAGDLATPEEVDRAVEEMKGQFRSQGAFLARLATEGYTEESYRQHIRRLESARKYIDRIAAGQPVDDTRIHAFYVDHPDKFREPDRIHVRHILLRVAPDADGATVAAARARLDAMRKQLDAGADFASLAREHSEDASAGQGGDLGFIARGQTLPPFEAAAFALEAGQVSGIVRSAFGVHLIRVEERRTARTLSEEQAAARIRTYLQSRSAQDAVTDEMRRLRDKARIEVLIPL